MEFREIPITWNTILVITSYSIHYTKLYDYYSVTNLVSGGSGSFTGTVTGNSYTFTGTAYTDFNNMVVATLRSRGITQYTNNATSDEHGPVYEVGVDYNNNNTWVPNNLQLICTGQYSGITETPYGTFLLSGVTKDNDIV